MIRLSFIFLLLTCTGGLAQNLNVFTDGNNRLFKFDAGLFEQIYYQQTSKVLVGNDYVCYVDSKGDINVHYEGENIQLGISFTDLIATDNILLMETATVLRIFDRGVKHILTSHATTYGLGDSLVLFQDAIGGYLKYYYKDEVNQIAQIVGDYHIRPSDIGANVFVYRDNTSRYSIFWRGKFNELVSSNRAVGFACGQDVAAFNDPASGTFVVFDNGFIIDAEPQHCETFACGNNFIYYKDASGTHKVYREERVTELGYDLQNIIVRDSLVVFKDIGATKVWYNEEIFQIYNDQVKAPQIDGGIMAYPNKWGGVSAFVRGEEVIITRQRIESFSLKGSTIVLKYNRNSFAVWWNGKVYDF